MVKKEKQDMHVNIYTDGACSGNPGIGGWGALLCYSNSQTKKLQGAELDTTNNRMELRAAIEGLMALSQPYHVTLTTDSVYVCHGITQWIKKWQHNQWRTANNKPVKNQDLWIKLLEQMQRHTVEWQWVKGHSGHPGNEQADQLARDAIEQLKQKQSIT